MFSIISDNWEAWKVGYIFKQWEGLLQGTNKTIKRYELSIINHHHVQWVVLHWSCHQFCLFVTSYHIMFFCQPHLSVYLCPWYLQSSRLSQSSTPTPLIKWPSNNWVSTVCWKHMCSFIYKVMIQACVVTMKKL